MSRRGNCWERRHGEFLLDMSHSGALRRLTQQVRKMIKRVALINFWLVATQALTAGFLMSGSGRALKLHAIAGLALGCGALVQAIATGTLWWQRGVSARLAGTGIGVFALMVLQLGLGYSRQYWLHVPIGVLLFGALMKQVDRSDIVEGN
jgi:hypothetical protein